MKMNKPQFKLFNIIVILFAGFFNSANPSADQQTQITQLYVGFFGRAPDPSGLAYWNSVLSAGLEISAVANSFAASKDSFSQNRTSDQIVTLAYKNLFNSIPSPSALQYWSLKLAQGAITVSQLVLSLVESAQGFEKVALDNRISVASSITNNLNTTERILEYRPGNDLFKQLQSTLSSVTSDPATVDVAQKFIESGFVTAAPSVPVVSDYTKKQGELNKADEAVATAQANLKQAETAGAPDAITAAKDVLTVVLTARVEIAQQVYDLAPPEAKTAAKATLDSATTILSQTAPSSGTGSTAAAIVKNADSVITDIQQAVAGTTALPTNPAVIGAATTPVTHHGVDSEHM